MGKEPALSMKHVSYLTLAGCHWAPTSDNSFAMYAILRNANPLTNLTCTWNAVIICGCFISGERLVWTWIQISFWRWVGCKVEGCAGWNDSISNLIPADTFIRSPQVITFVTSSVCVACGLGPRRFLSLCLPLFTGRICCLFTAVLRRKNLRADLAIWVSDKVSDRGVTARHCHIHRLELLLHLVFPFFIRRSGV